jgi:hypothetical protein
MRLIDHDVADFGLSGYPAFFRREMTSASLSA